MEAKLFHADGRTDITKLISTFCNFVNASRTCKCHITERPWFTSLVMVYVVTLSVAQVISCQMLKWLMYNGWGKDVEGSGCGMIGGTLPEFACGD